MFMSEQFPMFTKGAEHSIGVEGLTKEQNFVEATVFSARTLNASRYNFFLSGVGERTRRRRRKDGSEPIGNDGFPFAAFPLLAECAKSSFAISSGCSWSVDNDGLEELFILLEKKDGVVTPNSSASHEWFLSLFMCVSSGSVSRMFSVPVGGVSGWNCCCFSSAPFSLAALPVLSVGGKSSFATSSGCS